MNRQETALAYFMQGYNCAQATAAAFAQDFGLAPAAVLTMTAGFGGGMGGLRETCGAVSAMVYVAGLHAGQYAPEDTAAKKALYDRVKALQREFVAQFGTTCCRELLLKAACIPRPDPAERTAAYYAKRPCAHFVAAAAAILTRNLQLPDKVEDTLWEKSAPQTLSRATGAAPPQSVSSRQPEG